MINSETISALYSEFATAPELFEDRGLTRLMDYALDTDAIDFDGDALVFNTIDDSSPLRRVEIERIHGARELEGYLAVVLPSAIIFIDRRDFSAMIHIK